MDRVASPQANPPGSALASNQYIPQQPPHEGGASNSTQDPGGRLTTSDPDRQPAYHKCRADCLSCPDLLRS